MEALLASTTAVALAEIGDKTQLLTLFLMVRYRRPLPILAGILIATLGNHWLSAWLGIWLADLLDPHWLQFAVGISFIAIGLWLLVPDKLDDSGTTRSRWGPFLATTVLFFIAEIGDKTQIATLVLAAHYEQMLPVVIGTTAGMLLANIPVLLAGERLLTRLPLSWTRRAACILFVALGALTLKPWWPSLALAMH